MARNRTHLPWSRGTPATEADASFFGHEPRRWPRPDSPEVSIFTPEEEAEGHRRWRRAVLREKLSGPVSEAERLGLGLSAAALAGLAGLGERPSGDGEADGEVGSYRHDDAEGAGEVFAALKSAAVGQAASKRPVAAKPVGTTHTSLGIDEDDAFSNPGSSRTDNGFGARRAAPRSSGGGAPLEGRVGGGGAERSSDVTVLRKAEQAPGEARAPLPAAEGPAALRGAFGAEVATAAIAMAADLPEVHGDRHQAEAKGANGAAAKANQGQVQAEASSGHAKAKDAPPPAEARAEQRQGPAPEAASRDKAGDAPVVVEARVTADQGRASATEAPSRAKANDAAAATAAVSEAGADRKGSAAEAPVEAKAKDVASAAGAESGPGNKPAKALAQAKAVEVEVLEAKAAVPPDRGAAEAHGPAKTEGAPPVHDAKAGTARPPTDTPEQALAKNIPVIAGSEADRGHGLALAGAPGQAEGAPVATIVEKAVGAHGPAAPLKQAATAADVPATGAKAGQALDGTAEALAQGKKVIIPAFDETKAGPAPQQVNANDVSAAATKADPGPGHSSAGGDGGGGGGGGHVQFTVSNAGNGGNGGAGGHAQAPGQAKDAPVPAAGPATKADPGPGHSSAGGDGGAGGHLQFAVSNAGNGGAGGRAQAPGQAKDAPAVADAKDNHAPLGGPADTFANQAEAKDASVVGTKPGLGDAPAEPHGGQAKPKDVLVVTEAKAAPAPGQPEAANEAKATDVLPIAAGPKGGQDLGGHVEAPAGQAKTKDAPAPAEAKLGLGDARVETPGPAEAKKAPAVVEADPGLRPAEPPGQAKGAAPALAADTKAEQALPPAELPGQAKPADPPAAAHTSAQHGDDAAGAAISAALPADDALNFHAPDLWRGAEKQSEDVQSYVLPPEKTAPPVLHVTATDLVGSTNGEHSKAAVLPAGGGSPVYGTVVLFPSGPGEKGIAADALGQAAPDSVADKGSASSPAHKAADADPVGTKTQEAAKGGQDHAAATGPSAPLSGDAAGSVVLVTPAGQEKASGQVLTGYEAFVVPSATAPDDAAHDNGRTAGKGSVLEHPDLHAPVPDGGSHHSGAHDQVFF